MSQEVLGLLICILWSFCIYLGLQRVLLRLDQIQDMLVKMQEEDAKRRIAMRLADKLTKPEDNL
jgi:hypothetical protein